MYNRISKEIQIFLSGKIKQGKVTKSEEAAVRVIREDFSKAVT